MSDRRFGVVFLLVALVSLATLGIRFRAGPGVLAFFNDDFYYYLKVAQNIAAGHGSTFDSLHQTNGYHPLWMLVLVALALFFSGPLQLVAVVGLIWLSVLVTFWLSDRIFQQVSADRWGSLLCAAFIAITALTLCRSGMEIVLAIPFTLGLCLFRVRPGFQWTFGTCLVYALLGALAVLSRIDAILLVGPLLLVDVWRCRKLALARWNWLALLAGFVPLYVYLATNLALFSMLLPVSGAAKQLRHHHWPSPIPLRGIFYQSSLASFSRAWLAIALMLAAAALLVRPDMRKRLALPVHILAVMIAFPVLQFGALSLLSDWPSWPWYAYSLVPAQLAALCVILRVRFEGAPRLAFHAVTGVAVAALAGSFLMREVAYSRNTGSPGYYVYLVSADIAKFSQTHPGIYAMGDSAGVPGYLSAQPLVQLEGLVMNKPFLEHIRGERDLREVLKDYGVRYYVTIAASAQNGCYVSEEPAHAGPDSPRMRGTFCTAPVATFSHDAITAQVFELESPPANLAAQ